MTKHLVSDDIAAWIKATDNQEHSQQFEQANQHAEQAKQLRNQAKAKLVAYDAEVELVDEELDEINDKLHELGQDKSLETNAEFLLDLVRSFAFFNQLERQLESDNAELKELNDEHNSLAKSSNELFVGLASAYADAQNRGAA